MRKLGNITLDIEPLIQEMTDDHELQCGEILNLIYGYIMIHRPECIEQYNDGSMPVMYYGHNENIKIKN